MSSIEVCNNSLGTPVSTPSTYTGVASKSTVSPVFHTNTSPLDWNSELFPGPPAVGSSGSVVLMFPMSSVIPFVISPAARFDTASRIVLPVVASLIAFVSGASTDCCNCAAISLPGVTVS